MLQSRKMAELRMQGGIFVAEYEKCPEYYIFGLDIGTRSIVGTVGYREDDRKFKVVAQCVRMHETRAMLDGQIHDIDRVAQTIKSVKKELENTIEYKLEEVCIAAAGRVLKTIHVHTDYELDEETIIDEEKIHTLELMGMEHAYAALREELQGDVRMYCVGSSVIHYYLNDYLMLNLRGHKGKKISVDLIATFLPDEVIESLYVAVDKAGLKVGNLTLEPIAASEVAIPENFRLLNIALVDVGAGTSDISITKDGSIIGYGMIPIAGDAFTEEIAKKYLVDFATAEQIKIGATTKKTVTYTDIMGITHKLSAEEILNGLDETVKSISQKVGEKIKELNGGNSVSAVFIVGGGGKLPKFAEYLAENLQLIKERVAVRGAEVFQNIEFMQEDIKKDSLLVTPVGICLSHYAKNNNFIFVSVNGKQIKLYDNNKLIVMDAAVQIGFPKDSLFPKRGKQIQYEWNREKRTLRGEAGEGACILVNGKQASFNTKIYAEDVVEIIPSTAGKDAACMLGEILEYKNRGELFFVVNGNKIVCPRLVLVNDTVAFDEYSVQDGDRMELLEYYKLEQLFAYMDLSMPSSFTVNGQKMDISAKIYEGFAIEANWDKETPKEVLEDEPKNEEEEDLAEEEMTGFEQQEETVLPAKVESSSEKERIGNTREITITVNGQSVTLSKKTNYIFVDILDFYPFDTHVAGGTDLVMTINGISANFSSQIVNGDQIELYWKG